MAASRDIADIGSAFSGSANLSIDSGTLYVDAVNNRVGIGNSTPTQKLHVIGDTSISGVVYVGATSSTPSSGQLQLQGYNTVGGTGYHTFLSVYNTYGSATNPYKYLRITSTGSLEVINSAYSAVIFTFDNSGNFTASGNVTAYSDIRLKINIGTIESALDKVNRLRGVTYVRKSDGTNQIGLIAQEVVDVLPEVVNKHEDGMLSVAYGNIVGLLIEAIKEQQKQIEELKESIKRLEV